MPGTYKPSAGEERQVDPQSLLARQICLLGVFQDRQRPCLKRKMMPEEQTVKFACFLLFAFTCTHLHAHVYTDTCTHRHTDTAFKSYLSSRVHRHPVPQFLLVLSKFSPIMYKQAARILVLTISQHAVNNYLRKFSSYPIYQRWVCSNMYKNKNTIFLLLQC